MELHAAARNAGARSLDRCGTVFTQLRLWPEPFRVRLLLGVFPFASGLPMNLLEPQGPVAAANSTILVDSVFIMLTIVVPTIIAILGSAYWFRESNSRARFRPDFAYSGRIELVVWSIPTLTIILLGG